MTSTFEQAVMEVSKMHESQMLYRGAAGICTFYAFSNSRGGILQIPLGPLRKADWANFNSLVL